MRSRIVLVRSFQLCADRSHYEELQALDLVKRLIPWIPANPFKTNGKDYRDFAG